MRADLRELSIDELAEIIGDEHEALRKHQRATIEYLRKDDGSFDFELLEADSFVPRKKFRKTDEKVSDERYNDLLKLCGNTALYDDELEDAAQQNELLAEAIIIKQQLPDDRRAMNAFRACRSVAILGVALEQQTTSISQITAENNSPKKDARIVA